MPWVLNEDVTLQRTRLVVNSLLIVAPTVSGVLCLVLVLLCRPQCPFKFCYHIDEEERAGCFIEIVFLMSCDCKCFVTLHHSAVVWSSVCDCGKAT